MTRDRSTTSTESHSLCKSSFPRIHLVRSSDVWSKYTAMTAFAGRGMHCLNARHGTPAVSRTDIHKDTMTHVRYL